MRVTSQRQADRAVIALSIAGIVAGAASCAPSMATNGAKRASVELIGLRQGEGTGRIYGLRVMAKDSEGEEPVFTRLAGRGRRQNEIRSAGRIRSLCRCSVCRVE